MNDEAQPRTCTACSRAFLGLAVEALCPACEGDREIYRLARKKGDRRDFIPYPQLFKEWQNRRAECRTWRKVAEQAEVDRAARTAAELERDSTLAVLGAMGGDLSASLALAAELVKVREELARVTASRDRLQQKVINNLDAQDDRLPLAEPLIPAEQWRRLVQLAHPDKHEGSRVAAEATRWLLENRP